jgi:hypothetical protein
MDYMINENTLPAWSDLSVLEQLQSVYWDAFKDAHGIRPRGIDTSTWTVEDFEAELVSLGEVADRAHAERLASEADAAKALEERILVLIGMGADDRAQAIAWIADAEGANGDMEFLCFLLGVRYGYFR